MSTNANNSETVYNITSRVVNNLVTTFKVIIYANNSEISSKIILSPQIKAMEVSFHKFIQIRD